VVTATETSTIVPDEPTDGLGWPLQPLLDACQLTATAMGRHLGVGGATVNRTAHTGLSDHQADEWAIRLGLHPLMVWGWAWIDPSAQARGRPSYARVAARVRQAIARGELAPGDVVPGVKALAERWGVATGSVMQALDELRAEGLITGGGRGRRNVIASTLALGSTSCVVCGRVIQVGEEHYPHRPHCIMASHGWCDCDQAAHPECCPSCAGGGS
jgi:Bacterial regulatory proteins, gntR family